MIRGIGTDIVEIARIAKALGRHGEHFSDYILTDHEQLESASRGDRDQYIAGRWAAKEAVAKALGCGFGAKCSWRDIEIRNNPAGAPEIILRDTALATMKERKIRRFFISISHERGHAIATAVAEG